MERKFLIPVLVVLLSMLVFSVSALAAGVIKITFDGEELVSDTPPVMQNGRVMVPLRLVSEALGLQVDWNGETKIVTIDRGPSGQVIIVEDVLEDEEGYLSLVNPLLGLFDLGANHFIVYCDIANAKAGEYAFKISIKDPGGKVVQEKLKSETVGSEGVIYFFELFEIYFKETGTYSVELFIGEKLITKNYFTVE